MAPAGSVAVPERRVSIATHSRPREATCRRANLRGLRQAEASAALQAEPRCNIGCEHGNKRQLQITQRSVKLAAVGFSLLLTNPLSLPWERGGG